MLSEKLKAKCRLNPAGWFCIFLVAWGIINIVQALFTPLNGDEAYYWMYSRYPAWGYFDHPPMIAVMIRAGYSIFHNMLGVRLLTVLFQLASFILVWFMIDDEMKKKGENVMLLALLIFSFPLLNIFGFIATPDSPLMFFSILFLFVHKKFMEKNNWRLAFCLGLLMASLMYSKYHGLLLILLILLSDLKMLRNPKFYFAVFLAVLLFLPHIYWQYGNGFPTFKFHLVERASFFTPDHIPDYLLNTLATHNPLLLPAGLYLMIRYKWTNEFEKRLFFITAGIFVFFLISSFRYRVEPHWTSIASIPLLIIMFNRLESDSGIRKYFKYASIFSIVIVLFLRITLMVDFLPMKFLKDGYFDPKKRIAAVERIAGDRPVVFTNSYQYASWYAFYTGKFAYSINSLEYRKNQFDIWPFEEQLHGKEVLYVPYFLDADYKKYLTGHITAYGDTLYTKVISNFQSLQKECFILPRESHRFKPGSGNEILLKMFDPYSYPLDLDNSECPVIFNITFISKGLPVLSEKLVFSNHVSTIHPGDTILMDGTFNLPPGMPEGRYKVAICSRTGIEYNVSNSEFIDVIVGK